jgi:hypothetical protein
MTSPASGPQVSHAQAQRTQRLLSDLATAGVDTTRFLHDAAYRDALIKTHRDANSNVWKLLLQHEYPSAGKTVSNGTVTLPELQQYLVSLPHQAQQAVPPQHTQPQMQLQTTMLTPPEPPTSVLPNFKQRYSTLVTDVSNGMQAAW